MKTTNSQQSGMPVRPGVTRWLAIVLIAAFVLSLVPLYAVAQYSFAGVDDYRYGAATHDVWVETGSVSAVLAEAVQVAKETYSTWQGSVSAIFLMALHPGIFNTNSYWLSTALLLSVLSASIFCFMLTLCRRVCKMSLDMSLCMAALTGICSVQFVPTPVESYYWFNGGVYYTFYFGLSLIVATLLLRRRERRMPAQWLLILPLVLLVGTGNLVTGLLSCMGLTLYVIWSYLMQKERDPAVLAALMLLLGAFAFNALAPGNTVRQLEHADSAQGVLQAILSALVDGVHYSAKWLSGPTIYVLLIFMPLVWKNCADSTCRFRFPPLVSVASYLLLSAGFAPNEYALGTPGEARVLDVQFYLFVLLAAINLVWYVGWLCQHAHLTKKTYTRLACAAVVIGTLLAGVTALKGRNVACVSAVKLHRNGSGAVYAATWQARFALLEGDDGEKTVVLPKAPRQPPLLCMVDITPFPTDTYYWYNEQIAAYYHKQRVLREP